MKKFTAILVALLVAVSAMATVIPANAGYVPEGEDLLADSGLGDPAYIEESGISIENGTWLGHELWNTNEAWCGFSASTGSGEPPFTTREIVTTTLSNGSEGTAIRFANDQSTNTGSQFGLENIDLIFFDVNLKNTSPVKFTKNLKLSEITGRGGTSFQPAI